MKITYSALAICLLSVFFNSALARPMSERRELLQDLRTLTLKCVIRPYTVNSNGAIELFPLRSICSEIRSVSPAQAVIQLEGQTYLAVMTDSKDSDGGDLDDLRIYDTHQRIVAWRHNVPAFDQVFVALAGGENGITHVRQ